MQRPVPIEEYGARIRKGGFQLGAGDGGGAQFADRGTAGAVRQVRRLGRRNAPAIRPSVSKAMAVSPAPETSKTSCARVGISSGAASPFKQQHALFAQRGQQTARLPQPAQFLHRGKERCVSYWWFDGCGGSAPAAVKASIRFGLIRCSAPVQRRMRMGIYRQHLAVLRGRRS